MTTWWSAYVVEVADDAWALVLVLVLMFVVVTVSVSGNVS
jgi:hypothetical protein